MRAIDAALQLLDFRFQLLDDGMALLEILVQSVALGNEPLFPSAEALFLHLDLLREALAQRLFLLLELGVIQLAWTSLAKLAGFHLLRAVRLVVVLFGGMDQIEHVRADEDGAELLEIAVVLVLYFGDAPSVLAALDGAAIVGLDVLLRANDGEWHGGDEAAGMLETWLVVLLERWLVDLDALGFDDGAYLDKISLGGLIASENSYPLLESAQILRAESIGLSNNWDKVDTSAKPLHHLNVQWLESVAGRADEVQAGMDTEVNLLLANWLLLLKHVRLVLVVKELDDGLPGIAVVDIVAEAGSIDDG